jgi:hypothetical protein
MLFMNLFYRILLPVLFLGVFSDKSMGQDLKINEVMSSNTFVLYDEDGDTPDWLEIINTGNTTINLSDYYLSDAPDELMKWQMPDINLAPNQPLLIYASGKDRVQTPLYWNTIIDLGDNWKYLVPTSEPSPSWKTFAFQETGWSEGPSGFGYGDNDDNTTVPSGTISVFVRKKFSVGDLESLKGIFLHMDYDDAFVAYINGTEVYRAGMGAAGSTVAFNSTAVFGHEANIYTGGKPPGFDISEFVYLLNENENVLAVQVHNYNNTSSDLSLVPIMSLGYSTQPDYETKVSEYLEMPELFPHSNFKLSSSGETLYLTQSSGIVTDSVAYGIIPSNYSYGRDLNSIENWGYFTEPTPGKLNETPIATEIVKTEVQFSIPEMFVSLDAPLQLSGAADDELIYFTTDGAEPTLESRKYQGGILITGNMVIRARIFKDGALPGRISTRTYLIDEKPTLPVVSISTDPVNLWDNETGIYVLGDDYENRNPYFGANFWEDWEKPASVEMASNQGDLLFAQNCGIKIFGAWSRAHPQKSLAVFFRSEYGDPVLDGISLFKSKPHITSFKSFVLRNSGNDYGYTRFRDGMMTDLVKNMNTDIGAFEPVILYLNGEYWGEINLREKINEDYIENNHGVDADEIDILESNAAVVEGSNQEYYELTDFINTNNLAVEENYKFVAEQIDIENFIDYQLSEIYFNNRDWPGNNIKYWKAQAEGGKWRWILYDTDFGFGIYGNEDYKLNTVEFALESNGPGWPNPPWSTLLLRKLMTNQSFRNKFVNRFADMLNTTFVGNHVVSKIDSIANIIEPEIERHYARWNTPSYGGWSNAVRVMRTFAQSRVSYQRNHINDELVHSAIRDVKVSNVPAEAGKIKLNTIEVTGENWNGSYFGTIPITLTARAFRGHKFDRWEVNGVTMFDETITLDLKSTTTINAIYFEEVDDGNSIVINEINYNSMDEPGAGDWIELYNWGRVDLDISGWIFKDDDDSHQFVLPENTILKSDGYLVICRDSVSFLANHPEVHNQIGNFDFGLGSAGDAVRLFDTTGELVDSVLFGSDLPWPVEPNGAGPTLELREYQLENTNAESWKSSLVAGGTPGMVNSITTGNNYLTDGNSESHLEIYPNPFHTQTIISLKNNGFEPTRISIYSMDGRLILNKQTEENEFVWRGENQAGQKVQPGMYICRVQSGNRLFTEKVVFGR